MGWETAQGWHRAGGGMGDGMGEGCLETVWARQHRAGDGTGNGMGNGGAGDGTGDGAGWEMVGAGERVSDSPLNCADTPPMLSMEWVAETCG